MSVNVTPIEPSGLRKIYESNNYPTSTSYYPHIGNDSAWDIKKVGLVQPRYGSRTRHVP